VENWNNGETLLASLHLSVLNRILWRSVASALHWAEEMCAVFFPSVTDTNNNLLTLHALGKADVA
jgi:hypothetical protein